MVNAEDILPEAEEHRTAWKDHVRDVAELFHDEEGELFNREEALELLSEELDISQSTAQQTLSSLVSDVVDPVVQVPTGGEKYVGVVEYHEYDGAYGYRTFNDVNGEEKRVVCARCVETASHDREVTHATSGSGSFDEDTHFDELVDAIHQHYSDSHETMPEDVETGASLVTGTTIGDEVAFHAGNDGPGSNLDADTIDGLDGGELPTASEGDSSPSANSIAYDTTNEELLITKDV